MPFSFIDIEENKSRIIYWLFLSIILFYFVTAWFIIFVVKNFFYFSNSSRHYSALTRFIQIPSLEITLFVLMIAFIFGLIHWQFSTKDMLAKILKSLGANKLDNNDDYHNVLQNIIDEVCVAIGGRKIEAVVIPNAAMNAFAIEDFNSNAVIGVTEGLLARLNRSQIEAVVAHEAGHIISRDCLATTVTCCLAEIYEEAMTVLRSTLRRSRGKGVALLLIIYLVIGAMSFLSRLLNFFISRQREYRADAISVRLTRNPLSLAEALKLISGYWRGAGSYGDKLEAIFITSPAFNKFDESKGVLSDLFATHPPIKTRINILAGMAHLDEKTLDENLRSFKRISPVAHAEYYISQPDKDKASRLCPHCQINLIDIVCEGVLVLRCDKCEGVLLASNKISRMLIREDKLFSEDTKKYAQTMLESKIKLTSFRDIDPKNVWILHCPQCNQKMRRHFLLDSYPVEIDECFKCGSIWFDKNELEAVQYIYENKANMNVHNFYI
ncbi:MAG: zinc metalloprotease HtpX [Candidatus Omnitrophota bacterium]